MGWLVLIASTYTAAVVTAAITGAVLICIVWRWGAVTIHADSTGLRVGKAFLEAEAIGEPQALGPHEWSSAIGPGANRQSYLTIRPYIRTGVLIPVNDPSDPTPQWLVSSRRPQALVRAIGQTIAGSTSTEGTTDGKG